jgi:Bacterial Ig domain
VESMEQQQHRRRTTATAALGLAFTSLASFTAVAMGAAPAHAADGGTSNYAQWSGGSMTIPLPGFPVASLETTSTSAQAASGASAFLNAGTPFGAQYGSSQNQPYVLLRTAKGNTTSTTTLTFATPPAAGSWGFTLGDIDADRATLSATDASGREVPVSDLGFQSSFNFCQGRPLPSTCGGSTGTDVPTWDPATATLTGNVHDTNGASGWFRPSTVIKTLTIKYSALAGLPVYQLWVASSTRSVAGRVTSFGDCQPPRYDSLALLNQSGGVVTGPDGQAVYATVGANGAYQFPEVAPGVYKVVAATPPGFRPVGDSTKSADVSDSSATGVDFEFHCRTTVVPATDVDVPTQGPGEIAIPPIVDPTKPITIVDPPRHGSVTVDPAAGVFVYTPDPGYQGRDRFTFAATSRDGDPIVMTIYVDVEPMLPATGAFETTKLADLGLGVAAGGLLLWSSAKIWRRRRDSSD